MFSSLSEPQTPASERSFASEKYPHLAEAYQSWGINPNACRETGLAETAPPYKDLMSTVIQEYFNQEESFLAGVAKGSTTSVASLLPNQSFEKGVFTGHVYHRHALESFRLVGQIVSMLQLAGIRTSIRDPLAHREQVPITDEDRFVVMVATLLHDYKTIVPNPYTSEITSQLPRAETIKSFLQNVGVPEHLHERIIHFTRVTDYKRTDGWLYFNSKHEAVFNPPKNGGPLTKEQALQLAIVWSDIAGQMATPHYVQRRTDDLGIIITNPIPKGFKRLLGYCEWYGISLPEVAHNVVRNLAVNRLLFTENSEPPRA